MNQVLRLYALPGNNNKVRGYLRNRDAFYQSIYYPGIFYITASEKPKAHARGWDIDNNARLSTIDRRENGCEERKRFGDRQAHQAIINR